MQNKILTGDAQLPVVFSSFGVLQIICNKKLYCGLVT